MKINDVVSSKNIEFKNRIVMPPMATAKADEEGHVTKEILDYYNDKTKSGLLSAVISEHCYVDIKGKAHKKQMSVSCDSDIEGLTKLATTIHINNSLAILQISHAGSMAKKEVTGYTCVAPSAIISPTTRNNEMPTMLSIDEIKVIEQEFIQAAKRAKLAGFDGVELHSAHGYLLDQFLSPLSNHRDDEYGIDINGRIKIHLDILKGIKEELGSTYPVLIRMGAGDFKEGGLTIEDAVSAAIAFEKAGVDVLDISGGMCFYTISDTRPGYFDVVAKPIFDCVSIPVILTGGITSKKDIEDVLGRNTCDLVGVGRAIYKDSNWLEKQLG